MQKQQRFKIKLNYTIFIYYIVHSTKRIEICGKCISLAKRYMGIINRPVVIQRNAFSAILASVFSPRKKFDWDFDVDSRLLVGHILRNHKKFSEYCNDNIEKLSKTSKPSFKNTYVNNI